MPHRALARRSSTDITDSFVREAIRWNTVFQGKMAAEEDMYVKFTPLLKWAEMASKGQGSAVVKVQQSFIANARAFMGKKIPLTVLNLKDAMIFKELASKSYPEKIQRKHSAPAILEAEAKSIRGRYYGKLFPSSPSTSPTEVTEPQSTVCRSKSI